MNPAASTVRAFHVWFSTKGRQPVLVEAIRECVLESFDAVAQRDGVTIGALEAIEDHLHVLLILKPEQSLPRVMHDLKGASARQVLSRFPELRIDMATTSFWQKSYGWRLVPPEQIEVVSRYIKTQGDRPLRHE
jgi:putative transposase